MPLPTNLTGPISKDANRAYHAQIDQVLRLAGMRGTYTAGLTGHLDDHERLATYVGYGLDADLVENELGHAVVHHNAIHALVNRLEGLARPGPKPEYTKPAGAVDVTVGTLNQALLTSHPDGTKFWLLAGALPFQTPHRITAELNPGARELHFQFGAVLSGAKVLTGWTSDGAGHWFVDGQTQRMPASSSDPQFAEDIVNYPRWYLGDDLWRNKVPLRHVASLAACVSGTYFFDYAHGSGGRVYVGDDPTGQLMEIANCARAVRSGVDVGAGGTVIRNGVIEGFGVALQTAAVANMGLTQDCLIRMIHGVGLSHGDGGDALYNKIHMIGQLGVSGPGTLGNGKTFGHNEVCHCNYARVAVGFEAGGSKWATPTAPYPSASWVFSGGSTVPDHVVGSTGIHAHHNYFHHTRGSGLWCDIDVDKVLYEDNESYQTNFSGLTQEIGYDFIMRRNRARECGLANDSGVIWDDFTGPTGPDPVRWSKGIHGTWEHSGHGELRGVAPTTAPSAILLSRRGVIGNQEIALKIRRHTGTPSTELLLRADNNTDDNSGVANCFILQITTDPTIRGFLYKRVAGVTTFLEEVNGGGWNADTVLWVRFQVTGTSPNIALRVRWWEDGTPQPGPWNEVLTGQSGLDTGAVKLQLDYGSATEVRISDVRIDDLVRTNSSFYADKTALIVTESGPGWVYENTLRDNSSEVALVEFNRPWVLHDVRIYNNDITNTTPLVLGGGIDTGRCMVYDGTAAGSPNIQIFGNHYHIPNLAETRWADQDHGNQTWAQWQANGYDTAASGGSVDTNI